MIMQITKHGKTFSAIILIGVMIIASSCPVYAKTSKISLSLSGKRAVIMDSSKVIYSKNAKAKCHNASTTKLMTAIVAVEKNKSLKKKSYSFKIIGGRYHSVTSTNHLPGSKDKSVATVDKNGRVTAKKAGKAVISAKVYGKTPKCRITVSEQNEQI
ncbi:MAG: hypothetical protein HFJ06_00030 [Lachnospiraceae bacterium]|nr:hypothetical protein [Lachnospiraceae bacterium]